MQLADKYRRPTILGRLNKEGYIRGSMRGLDGGLKDFKKFLLRSGQFEYVQGHPGAAGISIKADRVDDFLDYSNKKLAHYDFNNKCYEVNFICHANDTNIQDIILDLDKIKYTWGQGNAEPNIAITNLIVEQKDIIIQGKNNDSVKIRRNGVEYISFKAKRFIEEMQKYDGKMEILIIGKPGLNEWCGSITPQIKFKNAWEIKPMSILDF